MIHVFFCESAAATFRQMLSERGIVVNVVSLHDELDFGPISHGDLVERAPWLNHHVPYAFGDRDWIAESESRFRKHLTCDPERLVWIAPACAQEQAGLYWYLSHFGGSGTTLAIADYPFDGTWNGNAPERLGQLNVVRMGQLYDNCHREPWDPARFPQDRWSTLVADNALLRVVIDGHLQSVPDSYFDDSLLAHCPTKWRRYYNVIADVMGDVSNTGHTVSPECIFWRLRALVETGQIACDGKLLLFGDVPRDEPNIRRVA